MQFTQYACYGYIYNKFLENQHVVCITYLVLQNKIVDYESATIIGIVTFVGLFFAAKYAVHGLLNVLLDQVFISLCYPNWKWPVEVCKEFDLSYPQMVFSLFYQTIP